jgi:uncharacterized protein YukE
MADIQLTPAHIDQIIDEMRTASNTATSNMDQTVAELQQYSAEFSGNTAAAWADYQTTVNANEGRLREDLSQAIVALNEMKELIIAADSRSSGLF